MKADIYILLEPYDQIDLENLQIELSNDQSEHDHDQSDHRHDQADTPYTALYTDYNTDLYTAKDTVDTRTRKRRKQHATAWCDLEEQKSISKAWSDLNKKGVEND